MEIIPAIDLRGGKVVRLHQGDFTKETVYSEDPVAVARQWQAQGAPRLHVVDLDGAALGEPQNLSAIEAILGAVEVPLQVGGGLYRQATIEKFLGLGIQRVILGTAAVEQPRLVEELCSRFGDRIMVSIDARGERVALRGWTGEAALTALELAQRMAELGVWRLVYTDIDRDGTLRGPNFAALEHLLGHISLPVIASGGISSLGHVERLAGMGVEGAIIGKALYCGAIDLKEALALEERRSHAP